MPKKYGCMKSHTVKSVCNGLTKNLTLIPATVSWVRVSSRWCPCGGVVNNGPRFSIHCWSTSYIIIIFFLVTDWCAPKVFFQKAYSPDMESDPRRPTKGRLAKRKAKLPTCSSRAAYIIRLSRLGLNEQPTPLIHWAIIQVQLGSSRDRGSCNLWHSRRLPAS